MLAVLIFVPFALLFFAIAGRFERGFEIVGRAASSGLGVVHEAFEETEAHRDEGALIRLETFDFNATLELAVVEARLRRIVESHGAENADNNFHVEG